MKGRASAAALVLAAAMAATAAAAPRTWRQVLDEVAAPSALVAGAKEIDDATARRTDVQGEALYFFTAQEMESDLDELTQDLWGEAHGPRLRELLQSRTQVAWPGLLAFLESRRNVGVGEALITKDGVLVIHFELEGRPRHLLVPVAPALYDDVLHMFEVDVPDTSAAYLGLLETAGLVAAPPRALPPARIAPPPGAPAPAAYARARSRLQAVTPASLDVEDLPFIAAVPAATFPPLVETLSRRAAGDEVLAGELESLARGSSPEDAALAAAALLLVRRPGELPLPPATSVVEAAGRGILEPRAGPVSRAAVCGALSRSAMPLTSGDGSLDLAHLLCGRARSPDLARQLGRAVATSPESLPDARIPPGADGVAFRAAFEQEAPGLTGTAAAGLLRWLCSHERHADDPDEWRADVLGHLLRDPVVAASTSDAPLPQRPGPGMRRLLSSLASSGSPAAPWAALGLQAAGDSGPSLWPALSSGIGTGPWHDGCLQALELGRDRDPRGMSAFVRGLRRSGDLAARARGIYLRLVVLGEIDRRELTEAMPAIVRGLSREEEAPICGRLLDLMFDVGAEDVALSAVARTRNDMDSAARVATVAYLMGRGRGEGELLDTALRLASDALRRDETRHTASLALARALERSWAGRAQEILLGSLPAGGTPSEGDVEAAALLASPERDLSTAEAGAVVSVLVSGLPTPAARRAQEALAALAPQAPLPQGYWIWLLGRDDERVRRIQARAGA